jgi:DNA repair protein RecO (recombination protein O)
MPIDPEASYVFQPERGALLSVGQPGCPVSGRTLIDLAADRFESQATLVEAKALMRTLINHTLGAKPLYTRQLLRELTDLNPPPNLPQLNP